MMSLSHGELRPEVFEEHGASHNLSAGVYRLQFLLTGCGKELIRNLTRNT